MLVKYCTEQDFVDWNDFENAYNGLYNMMVTRSALFEKNPTEGAKNSDLRDRVQLSNG